MLLHVVFSVMANVAVVAALALLRSAPPRLVVNVCLAGMLMIVVPWPLVAEWTTFGGAHEGALGLSLAPVQAPAASGHTVAAEGRVPWGALVLAAWLLISAVWLAFTFTAALRQRRRWHRSAVPAPWLASHALPPLRRQAGKTRFYCLPDSHVAVTTGLARREIWLGDRIASASHLATAVNHELCHLAAGDHYVVHLVSVLERMLWWNPAIWLLGRIARRHLEYDCDQRCKRHLGSHTYRRALAEIALDRMPRNTLPGLALGNATGVIKRMERLAMTYRTRPTHVLALLTLSASLTFGSATMAEPPPAVTLMDCRHEVPDDVHYRLVIHTDLNTSSGDPKGELSVSLQDVADPDATDVPEGAGPYVRCVMQVLGVAEENLPDGV